MTTFQSLALGIFNIYNPERMCKFLKGGSAPVRGRCCPLVVILCVHTYFLSSVFASQTYGEREVVARVRSLNNPC